MPQRWPNHAQWRKTLEENWHDMYGDRRQEIAFTEAGWISRLSAHVSIRV
jgi:hypothetical protein